MKIEQGYCQRTKKKDSCHRWGDYLWTGRWEEMTQHASKNKEMENMSEKWNTNIWMGKTNICQYRKERIFKYLIFEYLSTIQRGDG